MDFEKNYIYECNISAKATNYLLHKISFYPINKLNLAISHERISLAGMAIVCCNQLNASFMHVGLPSYTEKTSVQPFHVYIFESQFFFFLNPFLKIILQGIFIILKCTSLHLELKCKKIGPNFRHYFLFIMTKYIQSLYGSWGLFH